MGPQSMSHRLDTGGLKYTVIAWGREGILLDTANPLRGP